MNTQVKDSGSGAPAPGRGMKIYFCDICNESIPLKDINSNRISIEEGKIFCQKCAPRKARSGERLPGALLGLLSLVLLMVIGAAWLGWRMLDEQRSELRTVRTTLATLEGQGSQVPQQLADATKALRAAEVEVGKLREDLLASKTESRQRHETLDAREKEHHDTQQRNFQTALERMSADLGRDLSQIKDRLSTVQTEMDGDLKARLMVIEDRIEWMRESFRERAPGPGTGETPVPAPSTPETVKGTEGADPEDKEVTQLVARLSDPDPGKRYTAVIALARYTGPRVVAALEGIMNDPMDYIRQAAIQHLRRLGSPTTIPHVIQALRDKDLFVRLSALQALGSLTGTDLGFDANGAPSEREAKVKAWEKWWEENRARLLASVPGP